MIPALALAAALMTQPCTKWDSRWVPPPEVRVYLPAQHQIVTVPFRTYVVRVMAAGAWPSNRPFASLQLGAIAIKQYAWYEILHPSADKVWRGQCYDIRNGGDGQLYQRNSGLRNGTKKQQRAVDTTWAYSIIKNKRFFRTGWRDGSGEKCGGITDGWHLFEDGVSDCARKGYSWREIARTYYAPRFQVRTSRKVLHAGYQKK